MAEIKIAVKFDPYYLDDRMRQNLVDAVREALWIRSGIYPDAAEVKVEFDCPEYELDGREDDDA